MDGSGKCNIVNSGTGVYVAVFEMEEQGKRLLDDIEGVGKGYEDARMEVPGFGSCFSYQGATSHIDDELKPYDWYKEMVLLGCRKQNITGNYVSSIEAVESIRDPVASRSRDQWRVVERLRQDQR